MKIRDGFVMRTVLGQHVIVAEGTQQANFNKIIALNKTAAFLWENVEGREFSLQDLTDILVGNYDVNPSVASADSKAIVDKWIEIGLIDE